MTPEQFTYWLQGFAELHNDDIVEANQWKIIKDHLKTVFHKVTPDRTIVQPVDRKNPFDDQYRGPIC